MDNIYKELYEQQVKKNEGFKKHIDKLDEELFLVRGVRNDYETRMRELSIENKKLKLQLGKR